MSVEEVVFEYGELVRGDVARLRNAIGIVVPARTTDEFLGQFANMCQGNALRIIILEFGLWYIFGYRILFDRSGTFGEVKCRAPGHSGDSAGSWSPGYRYDEIASGIFQCAKLLVNFLISDKPVLLIDEPELFLEARTCRRLLDVFVWLASARTSAGQLPSVRRRISTVGLAWEQWVSSFWGSRHLNESNTDASQVPIPTPKQLFVASHSNALINEFLTLENSATVHEFRLQYMDNSHDRMAQHNAVLELHGGQQVATDWLNQETLFSHARRVVNAHSVLDNLGCRGSDLLQTNGVIWVEGPSDVIYIRKWIEMYVSENNLAPLQQGLNFEFQIFGGAILDSICLQREGETPETALRKVVEMFSFSRNAFVVIDSDAATVNGKIVDRSKFAAAKQFIKSQLEGASHGRSLGIWFPGAATRPRTLEDYLDPQTLAAHPKVGRPTKKLYAIKVTSQWTRSKRLSEFPHGLAYRIGELVTKILDWQR